MTPPDTSPHHIRQLDRTDWKCEGSQTTIFGPLTLLLGSNGRGKTGVMTGLQLAGRAASWGVQQRTDESKSTGLLMVGMRGNHAILEAVSNQNRRGRCDLQYADGSLKDPLPSGDLQIRWVCQEVSDALNGTSGRSALASWYGVDYDALKQHILQPRRTKAIAARDGGNEEKAEALSKEIAALTALLDDARDAVKIAGGNVNSASAVEKQLKSKARELGNAIKVRKGDLQEPGQSVSKVQIEEAATNRATCDGLLERAIAWETYQRARGQFGYTPAPVAVPDYSDAITKAEAALAVEEGQLATLQGFLAQWRNYKGQLEAHLATAPNDLQYPAYMTQGKEVLSAYIPVVDAADLAGADVDCPACFKILTVEEVHAALERHDAELRAFQTRTLTANAPFEETRKNLATANANLQKLETDVNSTHSRIAEAKRALHGLNMQQEAANRAVAAPAAAPPPPVQDAGEAPANPGISSSEARVKRNMWVSEEQRRRQLHQKQVTYQAGLKLLERDEAAKKQIGDLTKRLRVSASALATDAITDFSARVTDRLPPGWRYEIILKRFGRNVFLRTLVQVTETGQQFAMYDPSGGQYCTMNICEAAAMVDMQREKLGRKAPVGEVRIYAPTAAREYAWSSGHLSRTMQAIAAHPPDGQVILETTVRPQADSISDWHMAHLGFEEVDGGSAQPGTIHALPLEQPPSGQIVLPPPASAPPPPFPPASPPVVAAPGISLPPAPGPAPESAITTQYESARRRALMAFLDREGKSAMRRLYKLKVGKAKSNSITYDTAINDIVKAERAAEKGQPAPAVVQLLQAPYNTLRAALEESAQRSWDDAVDLWLQFCPVDPKAGPTEVPSDGETLVNAVFKALALTATDLEYLTALGYASISSMPYGEIRQVLRNKTPAAS